MRTNNPILNIFMIFTGILLVIFMGSDVFYVIGIGLGGLLLTIVLLKCRRLLRVESIKQIINRRREEKRTLVVEATVTKVSNMKWHYSQMEDASLECVYVDANARSHIFSISGVIGKFNVHIGDKVKVLVDKNNLSNYQIILDGIVD